MKFASLLVVLAITTACSDVQVVEYDVPNDSVVNIEVRFDSADARLATVSPSAETFDAGPEGLSAVGTLIVHGDTAIVVDQMANAILFLTVEEPIRRLGGGGDGPGELRRPSFIASISDTIFVVDLHGLNVFTRGGSFVRRHPLDLTDAGGSDRYRPGQLSLSFDGARLMSAFATRERGVMGVSVHPLNTDGTVGTATTIYLSERWYRSGEGREGPPLFSGAGLPSVGRDGLIYVPRESGDRVDVVNAAGVTVRRVVFPGRRRHVTTSDVDSLIELTIRRDPELVGDTQAFGRSLRAHPRAKYRPIVGQILAADSGVFAVKRADQSPMDPMSRSMSVWDIIEESGQVRVRLTLPAGFRAQHMSGNMITGILRDDDDVPSVVRYRW